MVVIVLRIHAERKPAEKGDRQGLVAGRPPNKRGRVQPVLWKCALARWLHADYRVVVPAQDLRRAMLWHSHNKYVRAHWEQERAGGVSGGQAFFTRQTMAEAFAVLGLCCNGSLADGAAKDVRIRAVGDDCGKCAEAVLLKVEKERLILEELYVAFECVREVDVLFPPVERM